ncbi:MAG: DDE-type integrase/transposase/recombinase, partial [Candidatus Thiodiazotropha taylori]|nr:DDE-type integrase/transposase/recombinase [Candidatus Thiodiazotropha taylori]MCW4334702.1 RNase H-like domain-containing protein [Candidatus Thiodiazotropha endolucinida]
MEENASKKVSPDIKLKSSEKEGVKISAWQAASGNAKIKHENTETVRTSKNFTKPATFDGTTSWIDYRSHFDMCAELNNWTKQQKGLYLGVSLRGLAQGVLGNLPVENQKDFEALSNALSERFSPESQTELYRAQLKEREWKHGENVAEFGQRILRLTTLAYPRAEPNLVNVLAMGFFVDSISDAEMRLKIQQTRPKDLNEAVKVAIELEAFDRSERQRRGMKYARQTEETSGLKQIMEVVKEDKREQKEDIRKIVEQLLKMSKENEQKQNHSLKEPVYPINQQFGHQETNEKGNVRRERSFVKSKKKCYICGDESHLANRCPRKPKCYICQNTGHKSYDCPQKKSSGDSFESNKQLGEKKTIIRAGADFEHPLGVLDSGLYCCGTLHGVGITALIDSGATATMISDTVYNKLPLQKRPLLSPVGSRMVAANGEEVSTTGFGDFTFSFNGRQFSLPVIVANVNAEAVLGLDFMQKFSFSLNAKECTLNTADLTINCFMKGKMGCYRIAAAETVSIPSNNEILVPGSIVGKGIHLEKTGIIEPYEQLMERKNILSGRVLTKANEKVPVRLMNPTNSPVVIRKGTIIGTFEPVDDIKENQNQQNERGAKQELPAQLQELLAKSSKHLDKAQKNKLKETLMSYQDVFAMNDEDMGFTDIIKHQIDTNESRPIKQRMRRLPHQMAEEADKQVDDMLKRGVIEKSNSPWAAGVVLVRKKDGSFRFCVDYRALNNVTVKDAYPLPKIDETLDSLSGAKWFSTLDLYSGYWQVGMETSDKPKTAFITRKGLFQFRVLPFGLCNAPATFERLMESILAGLRWDICLIYLDDVITFGKSFDEAVSNLQQVLERLRSAGLKLKPNKCELFAKSVTFLGHIISDEGVATDPEKIKAVQEWPVPINQTEVRSFLGLCGYYRRFIKGFSEIAKPLHTLTEKGRPFIWTDDHQIAFEKLKQHLTEAPILVFPDFTKDFILDTDASGTSIGAVLSQKIDGKERVVCFGSRTLSKSERQYSVTRKEMLSVVYFMKRFKHYLLGRRFLIRTDHSALKSLMKTKDPEGQTARWIESLACFDFEIQHRQGKKHTNADALSRVPVRKERPKQSVMVTHVRAEEEWDEFPSLKEAQLADFEIKLVRSWVEKGERPTWSTVRGMSNRIKSYWSQFQRLCIHNGFLCRIWFEGKKPEKYQVIIPKRLRETALQHCHDSIIGGHFGMRKTLEKVRQRYYWAGLYKYVEQYVRSCDTCARGKAPPRTKRAPMKLAGAGYPMERIATDILGPLPETDKGNRYILVISDYFTKWVEAFPIPDQKAETVAKCLVSEVISRFGVPSYIHSDQGRQFESQLYQEVCFLLDIKKTRTTPYHPQSDGMVERFNKTLEGLLRAFVNDEHSDWDERLPYVLMAYRSSVNETTGYTPNTLMLGREVTVPLDIQFANPHNAKEIQTEFVSNLQFRMEQAHEMAREHIQTEMRRQKRYHDNKLFWEKFSVGDEVYIFSLRKHTGRSPKFTYYWHGPYEIIEKYSDLNYKVRNKTTGFQKVVHVDRM